MWLNEATGDPVLSSECTTGGLVVRTRKGRNVEVQVPPGAVLFQLGEAAQIISGGTLMATPHAVRQGPPGVSADDCVRTSNLRARYSSMACHLDIPAIAYGTRGECCMV